LAWLDLLGLARLALAWKGPIGNCRRIWEIQITASSVRCSWSLVQTLETIYNTLTLEISSYKFHLKLMTVHFNGATTGNNHVILTQEMESLIHSYVCHCAQTK
jgi:hypothetical protein